jgi:RimJ/RimL family protein N-acetyltransferase
MTIIETNRLVLRRWDIEKDLKPWTAIIEDLRVMEFFPELGNEEKARTFIEWCNQNIDQYGFGFFACEHKESNELIGFVGIGHVGFEAHFTPCVEVGWRLAHHAWGKGYAPEAAKASIEYGFKKYNLKEILAFTAKQNLKSRRVMEKLGMTYDLKDDFNHPRIPLDHPLSMHVLYRIQA